MNIERVFKDYDWHPSMGDYHTPHSESHKKKSKKFHSKESESVPFKKYVILFSILIIFIVVLIFI